MRLTRGTVLVGGLMLCGALAQRGAADAASVFTPLLRGDAVFQDVHVCRVFYIGTSLEAITVTMRDTTGSSVATQNFALSQWQSAEVSAGGGGYRYCQVDADSNGAADAMKVDVFTVDTNNRPIAALSGNRVQDGTNSSIATPGLHTTGGIYECTVVNTDASTTASLSGGIVDSAGVVQATWPASLAPRTGTTIAFQTTGVAPAACVVGAQSQTVANKLRASFFVNAQGHPFGAVGSH